MSQQKAQLINATENVTIPGGLDISGVTTAGNFIGSFSGTATGLSGTPNLNVGIVTGTLYGDGSNLTGAGSSAFVGVVTAAQSGTTTIDLSLGNTIYFTQDTDTTVAFANTEAVQKLKFIRVKDDTTDARTITWPSSIIWNGGSAPTLIDSSQVGEVQIFNLTTRDQGVTWYGYEAMKNDPAEPNPLVFVVGSNDDGELGQNDVVARSSPIQLSGTTWNIDNLRSHGQGGILMTKTDGTLWSWGRGNNGQLGHNDTADRSSPTQIPGTQWSLTATQRYVSTALKTDGTLWQWGYNGGNGLGNNTEGIEFSSPIFISGAQWNNISKGGGNCRSFFATKTDGTMWSWGYNSHGQLGINDQAARSSPIQVPGTQWNIMASSTYHSMHIKTDGTLWGIGYNDDSFGRPLGVNDNVSRSSPIQLPGNQWTDVAVNQQGQTYATKTDGTLWSWGQNNNGALGHNDTVSRSSPTQIPGTEWDSLGSGYRSGSCTKTDGTLWIWGNNGAGRLGHNDDIQYSSPRQIPGTQWTKATTGRYINIFGKYSS
tara:strand:- start:43 stop:1662 length:1620 start_codon:yes stop_codon:yes gene_type:complete